MKPKSLVLGVALVGFWTGSVVAAGPTRAEWDVDGVKREALIAAPENAKTEACPVVFAFHGHGGTMQNAARSFHIHTTWPEAIVVYMQGLPTPGALTDPEGKRAGWQKDADDQKGRDLKFFDAVLGRIKQDYKVDPQRIYATGHSNGGGFTYTLWSARGEVFAAVAPSAAGARAQILKGLKPKPVMHVAGENDQLVKFENQKRVMNFLQTHNGCSSEGKAWAKSGKLVGTEYPSKDGTPVVTLIGPGTHQFPSEAPALIVKFFQEHKRSD